MKRLALAVLYLAVGLFLVFVIGGYLLPGTSHVERQAAIAAPPEKIFAIIGDLRRSGEWSPWFALDPALEVIYEGTGPGVGQKMSWRSNKPNVGNGSQTVTGYTENQKIDWTLDFGDMGQASAGMALTAEGSGTRVVWSFDKSLNGMFERWLGLMFDRWIGADYEKGLANLKAVAEKP
ncbi:MAG: SRPBCC family protein [Alphaproteobacteria bacterium]|nr:SRPBCC family protein [Alphaproteobacteria bacterium]